ncbi:MAG TPA: GGDEF domain-containing protein [Rhizobium sp.]|nr:GGDEF domain-containing protein [Rhizobium sp.]
MEHWLGLAALPRLTAEQTAAYERDRAAARSHALSRMTVAVGGFYLFYALIDILMLGDIVQLSLMLRFGIILPLALALGWYQSGRRPIRHKEIATLAVAMAGNLVWCVVLASSHSPAVLHYYYAAAIFQMVVTIAARPTFDLAVGASLGTAAINYVFIWLIEGVTPLYVFHHLAVYVPTLILTLVASHQLEVERQRAFLQLHENEALKRELAHQNGELARLSSTDPLTQLPNRRGTEAEIARLRRLLKPAELENSAALIVDIDHFKAFNDGYGHGAGDECLREVADAMRRELPGTVHLARLGGEEFLAVLPPGEASHAGMFAERMCRAVLALAIPHEHIGGHTGGRDCHVTVSIGGACGSIATDEALARLLDAADEALYEVKAEGRNGWRLAPMMGGPATSDAA